jgi:two-component system chemotaxis response regulator CheY
MSGRGGPPAVHVLIADDDAMIRFVARAVVERAGMTADEAADGTEVLAKLAGAHRYDVVLVDLNMPKLSGLDVIRAIRADPATARIPILVLTGAEGSDVEEAMALGATGIFPKPLAAEGLLRRIREVMAAA